MIRIVSSRLRIARSESAGFTIVEVLVAMVILGIVATSSLYFSLQANTSSSYQQHNQVAVAVANESMENALATRLSSGGLYADRGKNAVNSAFSSNSSVDGVSSTFAVWDTAETDLSSNGTVPIVDSSTVLEGTRYTSTVLIGSCFRPQLAALGTDCAKAGKASVALARALGGYVEETRIIVAVRWTADEECPGGCFYQTSTLIDQSSDATWVK